MSVMQPSAQHSDADCAPLGATESDKPAEGALANCSPYDGPVARWRARAASITWVELGIDQASLAWPTPTCGTEHG